MLPKVEYKEDEYIAYIIVPIDEGMTIKDLAALTSETNQPEWTNLISRDLSESDQKEVTKVHGLKSNALYQAEPIYIVCFNNGSKIGEVGPIKVID